MHFCLEPPYGVDEVPKELLIWAGQEVGDFARENGASLHVVPA